MWRKAIRESKEGVVIDIEVSPNSNEERIRGYNPWRRRIVVAMKEKPQKFRVNKELISYFSTVFGVPQENIRIVSGEKSTQKSILIMGVNKNDAEQIIGRYLA